MTEPPKRQQVNEAMTELTNCYKQIHALQEKIIELEGEKMTEAFKAERRLDSIKANKRQMETYRNIINSKEELIRIMDKSYTESQKLENYYVNAHLTDISSHGSLIPDTFFKVPENMVIYALSPIGQCTTFGDSNKFFEHIRMGNPASTSEIIRGGIYRGGDVMFDVDLTFSDMEIGSNGFMNMGVFPYFAKPLYLEYKKLSYWFKNNGDYGCKKLFDKVSNDGPTDLDEVKDAEDCMKSWVDNQGDVRQFLQNITNKDSVKLSKLIYYIWRYIETDKGKRNHIPPTIVLDTCLSFQPNDSGGRKTAKLVSQLEEFKENHRIVKEMDLMTFSWSDFIFKLR